MIVKFPLFNPPHLIAITGYAIRCLQIGGTLKIYMTETEYGL